MNVVTKHAMETSGKSARAGSSTSAHPSRPQPPTERGSVHGRDLWSTRLREIRVARGFSQEALASAAGIARGDVSRHERNHPASNPSLDILLRLAAALKVPAASLFESPGSPIPTLQPRMAAQASTAGAHDARVEYHVDNLLRHVESLSAHSRSAFVQTMLKLLTMYEEGPARGLKR